MSSNLPDIIRDFERVPARIVAQAAEFQPAILADVAGRRGALDGRIKALRLFADTAGWVAQYTQRPAAAMEVPA